MAACYLIRLGTVKRKNGVLEALKHNKRTLQAERGADAHIDVTKTHLNYALAGHAPPETIAIHAKVQMLKVGIETPRKNQVMAVEIIFSLPVDWHNRDTRQYFADCYEWTKKNFLAELLSFDIHLDEAAPHAHALIFPLINGKMQGSAMIGGTGNLMRLINRFHKEVACHHGLSKSDGRRQNKVDKQILEKLVLARLKTDPVMQSIVWPWIRDAIHSNPLRFAQSLSVELVKPALRANKSFVDYKRSKGKGAFIK